MKNRITLNQNEILDLLRLALPLYGYDVDSESLAPLRVNFGPMSHLEVGKPADPTKIKLSLDLRVNAPWTAACFYKRCLPFDLSEIREFLYDGLRLNGIFADVISFDVRILFGSAHLVAEYIA